MSLPQLMMLIERVRSIAVTALAIGFARFLSLMLFVVAARALSRTDNAGLIYVVTMSNLIVHLGTLGWLNLSRRMAARMDEEDADLAKGFLLRSFQIPTAVIALAVLGLVVLSYSRILGDDLSKLVFWSAIASIPLLYLYIGREYLSGFNRPALSALTSETLPMGLACTLLVITKGSTFLEAVTCVLTASCLSLILQIPFLQQRFSRILRNGRAVFMTPKWSIIAGYTVVGYGSRLLMDRMDTLILAPIVGLEQLALYNSATRIANLLLLVPTILLPVFSPRISRAFMERDLKQLRFEVLTQCAIIAVTIVPLAALLITFPDQIIAFVFGDAYRSAGSILWLIVINQVMFAFSVPLSNLLMMTDGEVPYALINFIALIVNLCAALVLITKYGVMGAAIATCVSTVFIVVMFIYSGRQYFLGEDGNARP